MSSYPSQKEFKKDGFAENTNYWSGTENDSDNAWNGNNENGNINNNNDNKSNENSVRCVR